MVFIDGAHDYENMMNDIRLWMPLIRSGGLLTGHDYGDNRKKHAGVSIAVNESFENFTVSTGPDVTVWITRIMEGRS